MSEDSFTEVTSESWMSRIMGSITGIGAGALMVLVSFPVLWWNEGRAVARYTALSEGQSAAVSIQSDSIDQGHDQKIVHVVGDTTIAQPATDQQFGMSVDAIALERNVEMYQWVEKEESKTEKKLGGSKETKTTYTYVKEWRNSPVNSASFKQTSGHENPTELPFKNKASYGEGVKLGAFDFGELKSYVEGEKEVIIETLPEQAKSLGFALVNGALYKSAQSTGSATTPNIGDIRVTFSSIPTGTISVIAQQSGSKLVQARASDGSSITLVENGTHSLEALFAQAESENATFTWILRAVGFGLMAIGFMLILGPFEVLADVVPFIGSIVGAGVKIIALITAACLSSLTIAIAWIAHRPLVAIPLLVIAVGCAIYVFTRKKAAPEENIEPEATPA